MIQRLRSFATKIVSLLTFPWTRSYIHPSVALSLARGSKLTIGKGTRIGRRSMLYFRLGATLEIGDNTIIGHYANIRPGRSMRIGRDVRFGQFVSVIGDNHRFDRVDVPIYVQGEEPGDVCIEDDVWLGTHVVVLAGVTIGRGSVIGAGAIVTRDIAPYSIAVGNPARVIRKRNELT